MSVQSEIQRISNNIKSAYQAIENKGVSFSGKQNSENLATAISQINTEPFHLYTTISLPTSNWVKISADSYIQRIENSAFKADYKFDVGMNSEMFNVLIESEVTSIRADNNNGVAEIIVTGNMPVKDMIIQLSFVKLVDINTIKR